MSEIGQRLVSDSAFLFIGNSSRRCSSQVGLSDGVALPHSFPSSFLLSFEKFSLSTCFVPGGVLEAENSSNLGRRNPALLGLLSKERDMECLVTSRVQRLDGKMKTLWSWG